MLDALVNRGRGAVFVILSCVTATVAYEASLTNLYAPSTLTPVTLEIDIQHRFGRALNATRVSNFFDGANTSSEMRVAIWRGFEAYGGYATSGHAFSGGIGYSHALKRIHTALRGDVCYFSYELTPRNDRVGNFSFTLSAQSTPLFERLSIGCSAGYDGYNEHVGLSLSALFSIVELIDVLGEYAPLIDGSDALAAGTFPGYSGGVKINTHGHHFKVFLSNSTGIGSRLFMLGAQSNDPHFGFSIERLFRFNG